MYSVENKKIRLKYMTQSIKRVPANDTTSVQLVMLGYGDGCFEMAAAAAVELWQQRSGQQRDEQHALRKSRSLRHGSAQGMKAMGIRQTPALDPVRWVFSIVSLFTAWGE